MNSEIYASLNEKGKGNIIEREIQTEKNYECLLFDLSSEKFDLFCCKIIFKKENRFSGVQRKKVRHLSRSRCTLHASTSNWIQVKVEFKVIWPWLVGDIKSRASHVIPKHHEGRVGENYKFKMLLIKTLQSS